MYINTLLDQDPASQGSLFPISTVLYKPSFTGIMYTMCSRAVLSDEYIICYEMCVHFGFFCSKMWIWMQINMSMSQVRNPPPTLKLLKAWSSSIKKINQKGMTWHNNWPETVTSIYWCSFIYFFMCVTEHYLGRPTINYINTSALNICSPHVSQCKQTKSPIKPRSPRTSPP